MISNGTEISFDVSGTAGDWPRTVAEVRQGVIDALTPFFLVSDVSFQTSSILSDPQHAINAWPYTATVRATVQADYGDVSDLDRIVAHAFYNAAGELPTVTSRGLEAGQGDPNKQTGFSLTSVLLLASVALVALAVMKTEALL